jgi:hypothetical protein
MSSLFHFKKISARKIIYDAVSRNSSRVVGVYLQKQKPKKTICKIFVGHPLKMFDCLNCNGTGCQYC